jgi:hypothetical protein
MLLGLFLSARHWVSDTWWDMMADKAVVVFETYRRVRP